MHETARMTDFCVVLGTNVAEISQRAAELELDNAGAPKKLNSAS
jgi:hypothetical protein